MEITQSQCFIAVNHADLTRLARNTYLCANNIKLTGIIQDLSHSSKRNIFMYGIDHFVIIIIHVVFFYQQGCGL